MKVAVTWQMCGFVDIDEDSMEKCMKKVEETSDHIKLPTDAEYVDGSFELASYDVEEMEEMSKNK